MGRQNKKKLKFTGERLIPEYNKGAAFFYEHLVRYLFSSELSANKTVLDVGCGVGYGSYIISKYGKASNVIGVDIAKDSIEYAQEKYKKNKVRFIVDDVETLHKIKDKSIDLAVCYEVIEHLHNQKNFLDSTRRTLKKNGVLMVSTPNKYTYPEGNPFHVHELYPQQFVNILRKYFKYVTIYHQSFEIAQIIKPISGDNFSLEEDFIILDQKTYTKKPKEKNSQYLIAVCSNSIVKDIPTISISSDKVDSYDISKGLEPLGRYIQGLNKEIDQLRLELSIIKESKTYKLWHKYSRLKRKLNVKLQ
ncbi:MAG: class I SAM-dependent methyltransferase [Patescibacteria group bacterium]